MKAKGKHEEANPCRLSDNRIKLCNNLRKELGIPLILVKERECLRCGHKFLSEGSGHRMCNQCGGFKDDDIPSPLIFR